MSEGNGLLITHISRFCIGVGVRQRLPGCLKEVPVPCDPRLERCRLALGSGSAELQGSAARSCCLLLPITSPVTQREQELLLCGKQLISCVSLLYEAAASTGFLQGVQNAVICLMIWQ